MLLSVGGELGPHLTQCRLGRGLLPYSVASDPCNHLTTIDQHYEDGLLCGIAGVPGPTGLTCFGQLLVRAHQV